MLVRNVLSHLFEGPPLTRKDEVQTSDIDYGIERPTSGRELSF